MDDLVLLERDGPVAVLSLNRPVRHNSLVPALLQRLLARLDEVERDATLLALVLQANGRSFSTGGDVRGFWEQRDHLAAYAAELVGLLNRCILAMVSLRVPVVAAVHGIVTGGSLGLVMAADLVLVAPEASFTPYYNALGFSPDGGWTAMLPHIIGPQRAAATLLENRTIRAEDAVAWGLAQRSVPAGELQTAAGAAAARMARYTPGSQQQIRRLLQRRYGDLAAALEAERHTFITQITTPAARAGMQAFLEP